MKMNISVFSDKQLWTKQTSNLNQLKWVDKTSCLCTCCFIVHVDFQQSVEFSEVEDMFVKKETYKQGKVLPSKWFLCTQYCSGHSCMTNENAHKVEEGPHKNYENSEKYLSKLLEYYTKKIQPSSGNV